MRCVCDVQQQPLNLARGAAWVMQEGLWDGAEGGWVAGALALELALESLNWKNKALGKVKPICYGWLSGRRLIGVMISWLSFHLLETWILRLHQVKGELSGFSFKFHLLTVFPTVWSQGHHSGCYVVYQDCLSAWHNRGNAVVPSLPWWCWREKPCKLPHYIKSDKIWNHCR